MSDLSQSCLSVYRRSVSCTPRPTSLSLFSIAAESDFCWPARSGTLPRKTSRDDQLLSSCGIPVFPRQPARLSHPGAGFAGTSSDIVVRACVLSMNVVDTKPYRLKKSLHWHARQYTEFIVAVQPMALFPLLTTLTRAVCGIEILTLRAFLNIQISQQHDAWISELRYDSSPHWPLVVPVCGGDAATHCLCKI